MGYDGCTKAEICGRMAIRPYTQNTCMEICSEADGGYTVIAQRRSKDLQVNLEPIIHKSVIDLSAKLGLSASSYLRKLVLEDLQERGLLTDSMLAEMALAG